MASSFADGRSIVSALGGVGFIFSSNGLTARFFHIPVFARLKLALMVWRRVLLFQNIDYMKLVYGFRVIPKEKMKQLILGWVLKLIFLS